MVDMSSKSSQKRIGYAILSIAVVFMFLGFMSFTSVDEGNVKVISNQGQVTGEVLGPGWYFVNPITESTNSLSVRPQEYTMSATRGEGNVNRNDQVDVLTEDGLQVGVDITVRYVVEADEADVLYSEYRSLPQAESRLIRPSVRSELRTEAGSIRTTQIYTKEGQERLREATREVLDSEFNGTGLQLQAVQIRAVDLPQEYQNSIEDKEIAQQRLQREETRIEQAELEKERKRVEAEASAEQIRIRGEALRENPIVIEQRRVNALNNASTIYVPSDGLALTREARSEGNVTTTP
jgi:regulator of protease activity HflC (stomatin/prohibitin superfamily)